MRSRAAQSALAALAPPRGEAALTTQRRAAQSALAALAPPRGKAELTP
jgi:hypothetical protein